MHTLSMNTERSMNTQRYLWPHFFSFIFIIFALCCANVARANGSLLSLSAELPASELSSWMNAAFPREFTGEGAQSVCQRVIGVKVCGDARWQYQVQRTGQLVFPEADNRTAGIRVGVPLAVRGNVGVEGDVSRLLGLNAVPVSASLMLLLDAGVSGTSQGCPVFTVNLTPQWVQKPSLVLPGNFKISFTEILEDALTDQVQAIQKEINQSLDCDALLAQIAPLWSKCFLDASQVRTGPGVWQIALQKIHWSVQTAHASNTYALVAGIDTNLSLNMGLTQEEVDSRLRLGDCEQIWSEVGVSTGYSADENRSRAALTNVVFDPLMQSNSAQAVRLNITHQAMANYAESEFSNRNLGTDEGGNVLRLKAVQLEPVNLTDVTALALQTQFNAKVRAGGGVSGFFQKLLGFEDKTLNGIMRVQARPVWDANSRVLNFEALDAKVTQLEPGSKLSLTHAAFVLLERQAKKSLAQQSSLPLGDAIDSLSKKINDKVDPLAIEQLLALGGQWQANTAAIQVNNLVALDEGMALDAQLNADWVIRFSSEQWPTDLSHLIR